MAFVTSRDTEQDALPASPVDEAGGLELVVSEEDKGARLDVFLVRAIDGASRSRVKAVLDEGGVRVNGKRAKKSHVLAANDVVTLERAPDVADFEALADSATSLEVVYEDADVVVVEKPAAMPTHPLRADERGTVANILVARYPEMRGVGYSKREPGIVHRLDTDTSGLVIAARNEQAFTALREALRAHAIEKNYEALVEGSLRAPRTIAFPIAPHPKDKKRVLACELDVDAIRHRARPAETVVLFSEPIEGRSSIVTVRANTAVRHQIRAHLAAAGHPIVGDLLYGGPGREGLTRHLLHATEVRFEHPRTAQAVRVRSDRASADMRRFA